MSRRDIQAADEAERAAAAEDEAQAVAIAGGTWAFQQLADDLCYEALDPTWHVRHGAVLALRELLRSQAAAAGVEAPLAAEPSGARHACCARCACSACCARCACCACCQLSMPLLQLLLTSCHLDVK